jgi:FixJ family two-component response regulator
MATGWTRKFWSAMLEEPDENRGTEVLSHEGVGADATVRVGAVDSGDPDARAHSISRSPWTRGKVMAAVPPLVLVVDDDLSVRKSLTRVLASAGYTVEAFASAEEFLARPSYAGPCCLVLDVRMPGLTGIQLQEMLAATGRRMSIVFVTGHVDVSTSVKAMKAGAVDLLTKPVDTQDLIAAIQRAVTRDEHDRATETRLAEIQQRVSVLTPR